MLGASIQDPRLLTAMAVALVLGMGTGAAFDSGMGQGLEGPHTISTAPCELPRPDGSRLVTQATDGGVHRDHERVTRQVTVTIEPAQLTGGQLALCTHVGAVQIEPVQGEAPRILFQIEAHGSDADPVREQEVAWDVRDDDGTLSIAAWPVVDESSRSDRQPAVDITVGVPATGPYDLWAQTTVGRVTLEDLATGGVHVETGTGRVTLDGARADGDVGIVTDVGDVDVTLTKVATGRLGVQTGTGSIDVGLPAAESTGYDVHVATDVGSVDVAIGPTESREHDEGEHDPGEAERARSQGYASKAVQMVVRAQAGVGDVDVTAR